MELDLGKLKFHATQYLSLPSLSSMWHFFNKKNPRQHKYFLKLEYLKLDLHSKLEFHELEFQKVVYFYLFL